MSGLKEDRAGGLCPPHSQGRRPEKPDQKVWDVVAGERLAKAQSSGPEVLKEPRVSEGRESRADPTA